MNETAHFPAPDSPEKQQPKPVRASGGAIASAAIVTLVLAGIVGLSIWYLAKPQPLIIQGEADATRVDIAARVDGRVGQRPVGAGGERREGQLLYEIDNPELVAKWRQAQAAVDVAKAQLANILAGTRAETIAQRKAEDESGGGELHPRPAHLRPHQGARRQRQCAVAAPRRGHEFARSGQARSRIRPSSPKRRPSTARPRKSGGSRRPTSSRPRRASTRSRRRSTSSSSRRRSPRRSTRSGPSSANTFRPGCRFCRSSISTTSGCGSICARTWSGPQGGRPVHDARARARRSGDHRGDQAYRDARRVRRLAGDPSDRRLRSEDLRGAGLSRRAAAGLRPGMSVYADVADGRAAMKPPARPGLLLVATRELRWMRRDERRAHADDHRSGARLRRPDPDLQQRRHPQSRGRRLSTPIARRLRSPISRRSVRRPASASPSGRAT